MNKRPIDKTKKSNIKCEHCKYWYGEMSNSRTKICEITKDPKYYYNRCKQFEWREDKNYDARCN